MPVHISHLYDKPVGSKVVISRQPDSATTPEVKTGTYIRVPVTLGDVVDPLTSNTDSVYGLYKELEIPLHEGSRKINKEHASGNPEGRTLISVNGELWVPLKDLEQALRNENYSSCIRWLKNLLAYEFIKPEFEPWMASIYADVKKHAKVVKKRFSG